MNILARIDRANLDVNALEAALSGLPGAPRLASPRTRYGIACRHAADGAGGAPQVVRLIAADSTRDPSGWALLDPAFKRLRAGENGAAIRAAVRRGSSENDPAQQLARLDAVGPAGTEQLARAGIQTAAELLRLAGPKASRARLIATLGREESELVEWAYLAELAIALVRAEARGADPLRAAKPALDAANLLSLAGIGTCAALAARKAGGRELAAALTALNGTDPIVSGDVPGKPHVVPYVRVLRWIAAARAVTQSLVEPAADAGAKKDEPADAKTDESKPAPDC